MGNICRHIVLFFAAAVLAAGCSTTRRLADGDVLYTGVKKMEVEMATGDDAPGEVESVVKEQLSVKPNNPLFSPYVRTPLPVGLWAWNSFYTERQTGFRAWLFRMFAKRPVLMSEVQPKARVELVQDILDNHGYFGSAADYEVIEQRNPRKARINYRVQIAEPWHYASIEYPQVRGRLTQRISELQATSKLRVGERYDTDSLSDERIRITNILREESYYYFRPEYMEYLADTTRQRLGIDLRMVMANGIPQAAMQPYDIGNVDIRIYNIAGTGEADSTVHRGMKIWYQLPQKVRPKILRRTLTIAPGRPARLSDLNKTLTNLTKLGIFRYVTMGVAPLDSLGGGNGKLDLTLSMAMDKPLDAEFEVDVTHKSSSFLGPGAVFSIRHKNFFHGGEVLAVKLNGAYEWQTGNKSQADDASINSYELGLTSSLMFPRILAPRFVRKESYRYDNRTTFQLSASLLNRPQYFRMLSFGGQVAWDFQTSPVSYHNLTMFKMTYNRLLSTTDRFESLMEDRERLRRSFDSQFIPSASYTYTLDKRVGRGGRNRIVWQTTGSIAGNILAGAYSVAGKKGQQKIFGVPFFQYVKATTEFKYNIKLTDGLHLATRIMVGAGHPYGNMDIMPYLEQFSVGGANSIRAFTIRSIGPGSFRDEEEEKKGNFGQVGNFKLEANAELRFRIVGDLHGAVFLDAGNIWDLTEDPSRPGSKFTGRNFLNELATGTGIGVRYDLSFLVLRLDCGIGIHTPYKNPEKRGYYNIGSFWDKGLGLHLAIGYPF